MTYMTLGSAFSARLSHFFGFQGDNSDLAIIIAQITGLEPDRAAALCWGEPLTLSTAEADLLGGWFDINPILMRSLANRASAEVLTQACIEVDQLYRQLVDEGLYQPEDLAWELLLETGFDGQAPDLLQSLLSSTPELSSRMLQALAHFSPLAPQTLALICGCPGTEPVFRLCQMVEEIGAEQNLSESLIVFDSSTDRLMFNGYEMIGSH